MNHTLAHSLALVSLASYLLPIAVACLAASLLWGDLTAPALALIRAWRAMSSRKQWSLTVYRVGYVATVCVLVGCAPAHVGSVPSVPHGPTVAQCTGAVDSAAGQAAYLTVCDAAMAEACYQLALVGEVVAHENPIDSGGAYCVTSLPMGNACDELGSGGHLLTVAGVQYCQTWISWREALSL